MKVETVKQVFVLFGGVGSRPKVKNELNLIFVGLEPFGKFGAINPVQAGAVFVISQLVWPGFEIVDKHQIVESFGIKSGSQRTSNEPSGPCDGNHRAKVLSQPPS